MRAPLTVAVAQPALVPYDVDANVARQAAVVRGTGARVVVFPELSLTGYELDAAPVGINELGELVAACREVDAVALVGAPVADGGQDFIATIAVTPAGAGVAYRKMWLHPPESCRFTPGDRPAVLDVDGWRLGLAICADAAEPRHAADTAALGIDAYVASALYARGTEARRDGHMHARAMAHGVPVVLATCAGNTGGYDTTGGSGLWSSTGALLVQASDTPDETVTAIL